MLSSYDGKIDPQAWELSKLFLWIMLENKLCGFIRQKVELAWKIEIFHYRQKEWLSVKSFTVRIFYLSPAQNAKVEKYSRSDSYLQSVSIFLFTSFLINLKFISCSRHTYTFFSWRFSSTKKIESTFGV